MSYTPTYSHGGVTIPPWTAVVGNTTNSGRPIWIYGANETTAMVLVVTGSTGSVTVNLEANAGPLDSTGNPPANDWIVTRTATLVPGDCTGWKLQMTMPCWRTRITARVSDAVLQSYCGVIKINPQSGVRIAQPSYPTIYSSTTSSGLL